MGFVFFGLLISVTYSKKDFFWTFHCFSTGIFILLLFFVMFHPDLYGIGFDDDSYWLFCLICIDWSGNLFFEREGTPYINHFVLGKFSWVYVSLFIFYSIANCKSGFTCLESLDQSYFMGLWFYCSFSIHMYSTGISGFMLFGFYFVLKLFMLAHRF